MACLPNTPVAPNLLSPSNSSDYGWIDLASPTTNALSQYYPISTSPLQFDNLANGNNQHVIVRQIEVEETATTSADIKKVPLLLYLYNNSAPTAPTLGAVYNASTFNLVGVLSIPTADYVRVSDTVWRASANPNYYLRTSGNNAPNIFYGVPVANAPAGAQYVAGVALRFKIVTEAGTAL